MDKVSYVAISGGIGVGKTTLTSQLADLIPASQAFIEYPTTNPYLADFYYDKPRWAFHSRVAMLAMYAARHKEVDTTKKVILTDRCIQETITFANLQVELGNLNAREFSVYQMLYDSVVALHPSPNVVVYLTCSSKVALQRILERNRLFEREISEEYLDAVESYYERWLSSLSATTSVLRYNTDSGFDVEKISKDVRACLSN